MKDYQTHKRVTHKHTKSKHQKRGGTQSADPSLNPGYCDGHLSQCQDSFSTCQAGGELIDPSINKGYCDAHLSQCQDSYSSCSSGGGTRSMRQAGKISRSVAKMTEQQAYEGYKHYKRLYKQLKYHQ